MRFRVVFPVASGADCPTNRTVGCKSSSFLHVQGTAVTPERRRLPGVKTSNYAPVEPL